MKSLLFLLLLAVVGTAHALSWREWEAIPVGAAASNETHRRLAGALASLEGPISLLNNMANDANTLESILTKLQGSDLGNVGNAVKNLVSSPDGANPSKGGIEGALERLASAGTSVVNALNGIVNRLVSAQVVEELRQSVDIIGNLWNLLKGRIPKDMHFVADTCNANIGPFEHMLVDLGSTQFLGADVMTNIQIARATTNAMVMMAVMRQICSNVPGGKFVNAATDAKRVAAYINRAGKALKDDALSKSAQGFIDKANSADAPTTSNEQILNPFNQFLDHSATLFEGLNASLNSDEFRRALASDRNTAVGYGALGAMIAVADRQEVKNLQVLNNTIDSTYKVRVGEYVKIDKSIDFWHGQKMNAIGEMQNLFGDQHAERMDGLNVVNRKVQSVTTQAAQGFSSIQSAVLSMQDDLKRQIGEVASKVQDDAGETRAYLSREIEASGQRTVGQISQINSQVIQGGRAIAEALVRTTAVANAEFDATLGTLSRASSGMSTAINAAGQQLQTAITTSFDTVRTVVANQIVDAATGLSADLLLVDRKLQYVNGRLEVLRDQLASVENKMQVVNAMLQALDVSVTDVLSRLRTVIADIRSVLFEDDWWTMTQAFQHLRDAYAAVVKSPQADAPVALFKTSCRQENAYDLFLSYLHVLDVSDADLATTLQKFGHDVAKYEAFGKTVIASLHQLSLLSTTCTAMTYNLTTSDLEQKSREHATLITKVARQFMRQVDELVPIYMLRSVVSLELETASTEPWGDARTQQLKAERLRDKLQRSVGDFAQLTVMYAGPDAARLSVRHVDAQYTSAATDVATFKRFGVMVSKNAKLAVFWGSTPQLAGVNHDQLDRDRLLSNGVFRGEVNGTVPGGCSVAQSGNIYPRCDAQCRCMHFENFASTTDPYAGRAITVLNTTDPSSDFAVRATEAPLVDYVIEELLVEIAGLGASAYAKVEADVLLARNTARHAPAPLWEDWTDRGRFRVAPSDVKGKLLYANKVTLTLEYSRQRRFVLPLFCDNQRHTHTLTEPVVALTYRCREVAHATLRDGSNAVVASGALRSRVDQAVCAVASPSEKQCKTTGIVRALPGSGQTLEVGRYVNDLTAYGDVEFAGPFVICKGCSTQALAQALGTAPRSFALATPSALELSFFPAPCVKRSDSVMACAAAPTSP